MTTAQQLLSQGNQTQQLQSVTQTVTSLAPWIVLGLVVFLAVKIFLGKAK